MSLVMCLQEGNWEGGGKFQMWSTDGGRRLKIICTAQGVQYVADALLHCYIKRAICVIIMCDVLER